MSVTLEDYPESWLSNDSRPLSGEEFCEPDLPMYNYIGPEYSFNVPTYIGTFYSKEYIINRLKEAWSSSNLYLGILKVVLR